MLDKTVICNIGRIRYLYDTALNNHFSISDDFYYAVKNLDLTYNEDQYIEFIKKWGTVSTMQLLIHTLHNVKILLHHIVNLLLFMHNYLIPIAFY